MCVLSNLMTVVTVCTILMVFITHLQEQTNISETTGPTRV